MDVVVCPEDDANLLVVEIRPPGGHPILRCPECGQHYELLGQTPVPVAR